MKIILLIFFKKIGSGTNPIILCVKENEKISDIIQKYRNKSYDFEQKLFFIFNAQNLNPHLTVVESGLSNGAYIYVNKLNY